MKRIVAACAAFMLASILGAFAPGVGRGLAQGQVDVTGQWNCEIGARAFSNDPTQAHQYQFVLALSPNGQFQLQGSYYSPSIGYNETLQGWGQWELRQVQGRTAVYTQGTWVRSIGGQMQYPWFIYVQDARTMLYNNRDQYTQESYLCRR